MTIDEIHIKVRQDVQKLNSHANGNLLDEEIDFHLNYYTRKFVDNVVGKLRGRLPATSANPSSSTTDFQQNQRLLDSLSTLQVKGFAIPAYVGGANLSYGVFPPNYRHLIEDVSEIACNRKGIVKNQVDAKVYTYAFPFLADYDTFSELELKIQGEAQNPEVFFRLTDYLPNGITDPESKYQVVNLMLDVTSDTYWENYDGKYYPQSFILVSTEQLNLSYTVTYPDGGGTSALTHSVVPKLVVNKIYRNYAEDKFSRRPNRLTNDNNLNYVLNHPFEGTTWEFPISTLGNGRLYVYEDTTFKVKNLVIDYIREPIQASKARAVNVDLPDTSTQLVVEQTIIHLKGMIQDPTWQTDMQHNQLNNQ
jgi:hypothetical protein